jgi:hypothetical protein
MDSGQTSATQLIDVPASAGLDDWRARLRTAVYLLYRERGVLPLGSGAEQLADLIDEGRADPEAPESLTRVTAESLAGAIALELHLAIREGLRSERELVPTLMYAAVLPYGGPEAAAEELRIPPPPR